MAYGARHMFYILFDVVLLTSTVAGVQPLSDMHVSGTFGALMFSSCTVGFYLSYPKITGTGGGTLKVDGMTERATEQELANTYGEAADGTAIN